MIRIAAIAALVAAVVSPAAWAEAYAGVNYVMSEYKYEDVHRGAGQKYFAGYRFKDLPLMIEGAYVDTDSADVDDFDVQGFQFRDTQLGYYGGTLQVGWFGRSESVAGWLKLGYYTGYSTIHSGVNGLPYDDEDSTSGVNWGLGAEWLFSRYVGVQFDMEGMARVRIPPSTEEQSTVTLYNVGLVVHFGA